MSRKKVIKKRIKEVNKWLHKYINGWKGSVSIFLALIITPFLSIALVIFESARYQSVVEMMNELIDSAGFSTLAEYDTYLEDRFGLLATAPVDTSGVNTTDVNSRFRGYLANNVDVLGNGVTIKNSSAYGKYALSDTAVLRSQLLEYGEVSTTTELVTEGFDIDVLIDYLMGANETLKNIEKSVKTINAGADLGKDFGNILDSIGDLKELGSDFKESNKEYKEAYAEYSDKADECSKKLEGANDAQRISDALDIVNESASIYKEKASDCKSAISKIKSKMGTLRTSLDKILEDIQNLKDGMNELSYDERDPATNEPFEFNLTNDLSDNLLAMIDQTSDSFSEYEVNKFFDKCNTATAALGEQITLLNGIGSKTDTDIESEILKPVDMDFAGDVEDLADMAIKDADALSPAPAALDSVVSLLKSVMDSLNETTLFYDLRLDAKVSSEYLYSHGVAPSLASVMLMASIQSMQRAGEDYGDAITETNFLKRVIQKVKSIVDLIASAAEFIAAVAGALIDLSLGLADFAMMSSDDQLQHFILYSYGAYNMPNRTTYEAGKGLSGYSFSKIYELAGGKYDSPKSIIDTLTAVQPTVPQSPQHRMFRGAEGEYLLSGTTDEAGNQQAVFFQIFLLRLFINFWCLAACPEIPKEIFTFILYVVVESFLDTFILVNGGDEYLIKLSPDVIYTSASGFTTLLKDFVNTSSASENLKKFLTGKRTKEEKELKNADKGKPPKGLFSCSYSEHLLLLLIFCTPESSYLQRMQNLIQLEAAENYKNTASFRLSNTYTYVETNVDYQLNPLFKLDSLTGNGLLESVSRRYHGY